ncbi:MAG TPA: caspase family protein [Candidatus Syntrophosphaera sp.]|nr:caspase family protein [Candidatus Syntrophosphaera sp.]
MKKILLLTLLMVMWAVFSAQTIEETLAQIEATKLELAQNEQLVEQKIAELRESNPLFAPQDPFESDFEYLARLSQASPQLERIRKQYLEDVWLRLNKLRSRTFETSNIELVFGKYEPNSQIWDITVRHQDHQKESIDLKFFVERPTAKTLNDNKERLIIRGTLTVDLGDKIGLARLLIRDPVTAFELKHDFHPLQKFPDSNVAFSKDGKNLACDGVKVYDISTGQEFSMTRGSQPVFSQDGKCLACMDGRKVRVFDLQSRQQIVEFESNMSVYSVAFSPDGRFLATGSGNNYPNAKASIYNLETRQQIVEFGHPQNVLSVSFSSDGKLLATGCGYDYSDWDEGGIARVYNLRTRQLVTEFKMWRDGGNCNTVSYSNDGKFIATGWDHKGTRIFSLESEDLVKSFEFGRFAAYCPVGNYLACSGSGKTQIFDLAGNKQHYLYEAEGPLAFSPDGRYLAIGDAVYRTFITAEGAESEQEISRPPQLTASITFSEPSGNDFLDALETGNIKLKVSNSGQGSANSLIVKLAPAKLAGLNYLNGYISEIPAGKTVELEIPIEAYIDVKDGTHTLNISFEEANGFPPALLSLTFSTRAFKRPELYIAEVGIDDSDKNGKIEAGEMIELTLRFRNRGAGPASAAYAKFYAGDNAFITEKHAKTQPLGDLAPPETRDLKLEIFINERCDNEIPLYVDLTEATGLAGVARLRVPILKSDQTRPVTSLVVTGTDTVYDISEPASLNIDVEADLPQAKQARKDDLAVIFGVENHSGQVPRVLYATRDAAWFREYALQALGIPAENIYHRVNAEATKNEFNKVFGKNGWLDKRAKKDSRVYVFFSGHGIPAPEGQSAYILPYDGDPNYAELTAYPLEEAYAGLAGLKSSLNVVFLDACFTGVNRENQALYATARPVFISPNRMEAPPRVNVFSAAAWNQMSNAWPEKQHGLFSYFLLKGMQGAADANSDRKLTLGEMQEYLSREVPVQAARLDKEQIPQLSSLMPDTILIEYQ